MVRVILFVMLFIGWSMGVFAQPNRNVVQFCPPQAEVGEKVWVAITAVTVDCPNDIWPKINKRKFYIRNVRTQVYVGGHQVPISASIGDPLAFITPGNLSGNQVVTIREGGMPITANGEGLLNIIGDDIDPNDIVAWFKADPNNSENQRLQMKFEGVLNSIISGLVRTSRVSRVNPMYVRNKLQTLLRRKINNPANPCFGNLAVTTVPTEVIRGKKGLFLELLRQALDQKGLLKEGLDNDPWDPAPQSDGAMNQGRKIIQSQGILQLREVVGMPADVPTHNQVTIAVLDSGTAKHNEFGTGSTSRLQQGYDVSNDSDSSAHKDQFLVDNYVDKKSGKTSGLKSDGHGTPVAVLAAGKNYGIAYQARVLPIKVCNPRCLGSDVFLGVCYALNFVDDQKNLVLNLSLGGASRFDLVRDVLSYATRLGTIVVAAAGAKRDNINFDDAVKYNEFPFIDPWTDKIVYYEDIVDSRYQFYPAAYSIHGMLSVGGVEKNDPVVPGWRIIPNSLVDPYIAIYAPGGGLISGNLEGAISDFKFEENEQWGPYFGTSFATPIVSGAMALLRGICPDSPAQNLTQLLLTNFRKSLNIHIDISNPDKTKTHHDVYMLDLSPLSSFSSSNCP